MTADSKIAKLYALVPIWVDDFVSTRPDAEYLRDDLEGEAAVKLVETVRERPDAPQAYVRKAVLNRLADFAGQAGAIAVPRRTAAGIIDRGEQVPGFRRLSADALDHVSVSSDPAALGELVEELEACCGDDLDRAIVAGIQTESIREIAERLGEAKSTIADRWKTISEKFRNRAGQSD